MPHDKALRALADPHRWSLYEYLRRVPTHAAALATEFSLSRPAVIQHLKLLLDAGLVSRQVAGRKVLYRAESEALDALRATLDRLRQVGPQSPAPASGAYGSGVFESDLDDELELAASRWGEVWLGQDPNVYAVTMRLLLLGRHVDRALRETAERHGLQGSELLLLDVLNLAREGVLTPSQLQARLGVTKGAVTKLMTNLEQQDLISRAASVADRRVSYVSLTQKGREALVTILERHEYGADHAAAKQLPVDQLDRLATLLRRYHQLMNQELLSRRKSGAALSPAKPTGVRRP